jgi:nitrite reductase/ring-hydroxylating ferredoxin subunit
MKFDVFLQIKRFAKRMLNRAKLIKIFVIPLVFAIINGCDENDQWIPNVRVQKSLHLSTDLATLGLLQAGTFEGGVNGLIVFRLADREFNAFDRTCPFQPAENCAVNFNEMMLSAECPCCGSQFELFESGAVQKGPARRPLKQYRAVVTGDILHISN